MSIDLEMEEILKVFFDESEEGLNAMETGLLTLGESNCSSADVINTIFRAAHSIKGGAGTFGFMEISHFTHSVETLLDEMRNGKRAVSPEALQLLLQSVDVIRGMVRSAQAKQPIDTVPGDVLSGELLRLLSQDAAGVPPAPAQAPKSLAAGWRIVFAPDPSLFNTCNDPVRIFGELATLVGVAVQPHVERVPRLSEIDPTLCYLSWTLDVQGDVEQAKLREVFDWVDATSSITYERVGGGEVVSASAPESAAAPASPPAIAAAMPLAGTAPVTVPSALVSAVASAVAAETRSETPGAIALAAGKAPVHPKAAGDAGSIRVSTEKVDALINLVGELVITQSMLGRFADKCDPEDLESLRRGLMQLSRNTRELQESVMAIRMLPIGFSFNRFPRLVHDLSRKLGKKVELKIRGENTELDKTVLEKIGDPLVHLVRNSLDHGLELPEVRAAAGKPETGVIELNAFHEGGSIVIEVKDDGAGLNTKRILAKARERGLVGAGDILSDTQIHDLIFEAGFSTADSVSDVSGRGVGMDVVRRNIADLGGQVQIDSVAGHGSTIRIRLPLTLAILDAQMLRVGKEIYVVSLVSIIETVQPSREHLSSVVGQTELFMHRGDYIPIIRLHTLFDIEPDSSDIPLGLLVVVEADGGRAAILVDELLAQQQVVIKSLETNFRQVPGLAGATIHGDGTVALILDIPGLIGSHLRRPSRRVGRAA
jgi:two-component system, chemotaxis family, sensor kinase CheA